jgi:tRNA(Ile)-lysidine synthase
MAPPGRAVPEAQLAPGALAGALSGLGAAPHWYVALSGGLDSTVLLHLLAQWRDAHPGSPPLTAIHINHGLQHDADAWQSHCDAMCKKMHIPLLCRRVEVRTGGGGLEAAARDARYRVFERQLGPGEVLFLGHHNDDQIETFFLRLLRGAGVRGLAAMPARRPLGEGLLARPLLDFDRAEVEGYAAHHKLRWVEDPSNRDPNLDRNFLRAEVLPLVASRWPGYRRNVSRTSAHMAASASLIDELLPVPDTVHSVIGDPGIPLAALQERTGERAAQTLRNWLQASGLRAPDSGQLREFLRQLREAGIRKRPRLECGDYTLQRYRDAVYLLPAPAAQPDTPLTLAPGECIDLPGVGRVALEPAATGGLLLGAGETPQLAWRGGGERCRLRGREGSRSLKKLLQECGMPPWWRARTPLLFLGDELLAVGALGACHSSRWRESSGGDGPLWAFSWQPDIDPACD